jgi:5'-3' exonuclease
MSKQFLLVDGKNLLYRAGFASRNLKTRDGRYSGAIHGFIKMLCRVRVQHPDVEIIILWEQAGQLTYRHKIFPPYKDRSKTPGGHSELSNAISLQIVGARNLCKAVGLKWVEIDKIEADDLAGLLTVSLTTLQHEILLLSGDCDWWQLAPIPGVTVLCEQGVGRDEPVLTDERVFAKFECKAKDLLKLRPFIGDTSDKIPPVRPRFMKRNALELVRLGVNPKLTFEQQPQAVKSFPDIRALWPNYIRNYKLMKIARSLDDCQVSVETFNAVMNLVTGDPLPKNYQDMLRVLADWELEDAMGRRTFIFSIASTLSPGIESQMG